MIRYPFSCRLALRSTLVFFLLPLFPAIAGAAGQPPAKPQDQAPPAQVEEDETFFESIDVSVVNVDVIVTDKSGRRVTGLTKDDFEVREDGKPVDVTNFYAEAGEAATAATPAGAATSAGAAGATTGAPAVGSPAPVPEEQRLYLTLFIDNRNLPASTRNTMLPAIEKFVSTKLRTDDRLMLVSYDGTDVVVRQSPTNDPVALTAAIEQMAKSTNAGNSALLERRQVLFQLNTGAVAESSTGRALKLDSSEQDSESIRQSIESMAQKEYTQTRETLETIGHFVDSLSGLPGRKIMLYVGGGMSLRPGESMMRAYINKYPTYANQHGVGVIDSFEKDTSQMFERLVQRANSHRVTFYTMGGATNVNRASAEFGDNASYTSDLEAIDRVNDSSPLALMASGTGGLSAFDISKPETLMDRMRDDFNTYYSLGYVPSHRADGKNHKLAVVMKDKSLRVRYREGFRSETAAERASSRTMAALLLGVAQNPLDVAVEFEDETRDKKGNPVVSILVKFPMAKLVLLPQEHVHEGKIRVYVGARDAKGRSSDVTEVPVPIRIPNDQLLTALGQTATFRVSLALRSGDQTIAVSVRDDLGNVDSTVTSKYTAGSRVAATGPKSPGA